MFGYVENNFQKISKKIKKNLHIKKIRYIFATTNKVNHDIKLI